VTEASHAEGLMVGMFWGGLLVASVPILLTLGIGIYVLRRMAEARSLSGAIEETEGGRQTQPDRRNR